MVASNAARIILGNSLRLFHLSSACLPKWTALMISTDLNYNSLLIYLYSLRMGGGDRYRQGVSLNYYSLCLLVSFCLRPVSAESLPYTNGITPFTLLLKELIYWFVLG